MTGLWRHAQQWQQVNNIIAFKNLYAKLCFGRVLKRSLSPHLMQVNLLLVTFYLNGGLHAVSVRKPFERMLNFWTIRFLKPKRIPIFRTSLQFTCFLVAFKFTGWNILWMVFVTESRLHSHSHRSVKTWQFFVRKSVHCYLYMYVIVLCTRASLFIITRLMLNSRNHCTLHSYALSI